MIRPAIIGRTGVRRPARGGRQRQGPPDKAGGEVGRFGSARGQHPQHGTVFGVGEQVEGAIGPVADVPDAFAQILEKEEVYWQQQHTMPIPILPIDFLLVEDLGKLAARDIGSHVHSTITWIEKESYHHMPY